MFENMQIPVITQFNPDCWANDEEKTLAQGDTSVTFNIEANPNYGYELFLDKSTAATANTDPPKQIGQMVFGSGTCTINLTTVTAAQAGTKARLRVFK